MPHEKDKIKNIQVSLHFSITIFLLHSTKKKNNVVMNQTNPGVAVILYLTTDESPFSPQMRALTGFGVIIGLLLLSGELSTAGLWSSFVSFASDSEENMKSELKSNQNN